VTGSFSLIGEKERQRIIVDFTGKSRREAKIRYLSSNKMVFVLDTWMGPVEFRVEVARDNVQGIAIVGNAPYKMDIRNIINAFQSPQKDFRGKSFAEKKNAQKQLPGGEPVAHLSAQQQQFILGGEAALWTEIVDEQTIDLRLWPRAFVVAERLWSAQSLQDEQSMYQRLYRVANWAEKSAGLQHNYQQQIALEDLLGNAASATEIHAMEIFMQLLEPAHYYHRQHEKSAHESYSKADPLNRLVDALPAESEALRQFNNQLAQWLANPQANALLEEIKSQLLLWAENRKVLDSLLVRHPQWRSLADNTDKLVGTALMLLDKRAQGKPLPITERETIEEMLQSRRQMDQEIIIALVGSLEKILYSF
jgi:hexosaminidase